MNKLSFSLSIILLFKNFPAHGGTMDRCMNVHLGNIRAVVSQNDSIEEINHYYPYGSLFGESTGLSNETQPYKYTGKELDRMHGLDMYDYGARLYDPVIARWGKMDNLSEDYYPYSPYNYGLLNPINNFDPDGNRVYMLFYTSGNSDKDADRMFRAAAETRKQDIMSSSEFNPNSDIVILEAISDLGQIENIVNNIVKNYSERYGTTAEFGLWSHSAIDGPVGTELTSHDALDQLQMTPEGWSKINFNWGENASAYFYGCRSGAQAESHNSFITTLSSKKNFQDVNVYGQTTYAYPSMYTNIRKSTIGMYQGHFSYPTYMVGGNKGEGGKALLKGVPATTMKRSINGKGYLKNYYQIGRRY